MSWVLIIIVALASGLLLHGLQIPGGALLGALIGSATVSTLLEANLRLPRAATVLILTGVGLMIGTELDRERIRALRSHVVPAVLSALALVSAGLVAAVLLGRLGIAPEAAFLATSPGGLSVLVAVATEQGRGEAGVTIYHTIRLLIILGLIPLLLRQRARHG